MTNEMMNLQALLAKSADADFLREMISFALPAQDGDVPAAKKVTRPVRKH